MNCVFCGRQVQNLSLAHIIPESLGGANSPVCPPDVTCDPCNQYFGQKVEAIALKSFPLDAVRLFCAVPSKKGRMYSTDSMLGTVWASRTPNRIEVEPRDAHIAERLADGEIKQLRILAEISEPLAVCRLLLKIGIELLAKHFPDVARSERISEARMFARRPQRNSKWWFMFRSDPSERLPHVDGLEKWSTEIREIESHLCSVVSLPSMKSLIPLESRLLPPSPTEFPEPLYRIVWAKC